MAIRIAGVDIPDQKPLKIALTEIYGIGRSRAEEILAQAKIDPDTRPAALSTKDQATLREVVEKQYTIEGELRRERMMNVKRLKEIGTYRGQRHKEGLPVRGQQTQTNSRTVRGNTRRTMASGRKAPPSPT